MATATPLCGTCDFRHVSKPAIVWCSECDEGLCTECCDHHSSAKATRYHTTTPIEDYQKLPSDILQIQQFCREHEQRFILFCKYHDSPCCRTCVVQDHKQCQDVLEIEKVVQNVKTSNAFQETEQIIAELTENIQNIQKDQKENLTSLKKKQERVKTEIKEFRVKLNDHFDKLQEDIMKDLNKTEETERKKIQKTVDDLQKMGKDINEIQTNLSNIKQYASDLQAYLAMKQIQNDVNQSEATIDSLVNSNKLQQKLLSLKNNSAMKNIMSSIKIFGNIVVETKGPNLVPTKKKNKQAQLLVPHQPRTIDNLTLKLQQTLKVDSNNITGCCILPDGRMVFSQYFFSQHKLVIMNTDGTHNTTLNTSSWAFGVIYVKYNDCLAVTSGGTHSSCITFINIKSNKVQETIELDSPCYGIAVKKNTLYFCGNESINSLNLTDKTITKFIGIKPVHNSYIDIYENNLYHTNYITDTVTCYDLSGEVKWEFKDESLIKGPRGISVDNRGYVYVYSTGTSKVVVISPDGQKCRELLSTKDNLYKPWAIHYNRSTDKMLVANLKDTAFLYKYS